MKTKILITALVGFLVVSVVAIGMLVPASAEAKGKPEAPAAKAGEKARAPDLEMVEFIHWRRKFAKPPCNGDGICDPDENPSCRDCKSGDEEPDPTEPTCYAFMGQYGKRLLKWGNTPVSYVINPSNLDGIPEADVKNAISAAAEEWDGHTGAELFGTYSITDTPETYGVQDYENAISFQDYYTDPDIIAACRVWYNPATKTIVEFDIVFEENYYWDTDGGETDMDVRNIATHELGHGVGLDDVYDAECSDVTMYGYSGYGDTDKIDLADPDITGIQTLYGP